MKTRILSHKTARCITCPHFLERLSLCNLYPYLIEWPTVEPDSFCGHHPDNEPLVENKKEAKENPFSKSKFYRKIPSTDFAPKKNWVPHAGYGETKGLVKLTL